MLRPELQAEQPPAALVWRDNSWMPVKSQPKERPIIKMLLSAYENGTWQDACLNWVEERQDGAVEVIATKADGTKLALEHTLIQPFVGEKFDSERFMRAFGRIEKNPSLVLPNRKLKVIIPVHAIPIGYNWDEVGEDLLAWLVVNHVGAPKEGESEYTVPVGDNSKNGPLLLRTTLQTTNLPGIAGSCLISRDRMPGDLGIIVEKALKTKIPKLVKTRVLLLELDQIVSNCRVYKEVVKLAPNFPELARIHEIWFVNTSGLASDGWVDFELMDGRGTVELLSFENGILKGRRDDRLDLGPPGREF